MARKNRYQLLCPIARALDALGDRWSLLILRDLHAGPARYQQLQDGLGMATNLLSTRLTELQDAGLVEKAEIAGRASYRLTELGTETDLVLWELARFGGRLDPDPEPRRPGNLRTVVLPLRLMLASVADRPNLTANMLVEDETFTIISTPQSVDVIYGPNDHPVDLVVRTDYPGLVAVGDGRLSLDDFGAKHLELVDGAEHLPAFVDLMVKATAAT